MKNFLENFTVQRLGKVTPNYSRMVKLNVGNKTIRDNILKKSNLLKDFNEPWSKVYLKKDLHPVIVQENRRLWKKKKELLRLNENSNIRIEKGKLLCDGRVIDQNLFFS